MSRAGATAAQRKRAAKRERRASGLAARDLQVQATLLGASLPLIHDFAYLVCEACGQEQSEKPGCGCVVCGHDIARSHPQAEEIKQTGIRSLLAKITLLGDGSLSLADDDEVTSTYTGTA